MRNLAELLWKTVIRTPEKRGVSFDGRELTWGEVYQRSAFLAQRLRSVGIGRSDVVAIYAEHSPAQVVGIFATAMADGIFTIVSPLLKENQVKHQIFDASVKAIVGTESFVSGLEELCKDRQIHAEVITTEGVPVELLARDVSKGYIGEVFTTSIPNDVSNIIYTSGSSGRAKGVMIPHRTLLDGARIVSDYLKISGDDVLLGMLPFNFDYGLNQLLAAAYTGARLVLHRFTFPQDLVDTLVREQVTGMAAVPSLWPHLFNPRLFDPGKKPEFDHLRYVTTAGGPHSQELLTKLSAFFPRTDIIIMYGLTESFRSTYLPPSELFKRSGSIGKAVPEVEILVLNEEGEHCKPGEKGELIHRGAFVSYGYLNDPDLTERKFIHLKTGGPGCLPEIVVRSGDIVSLDEDGFIYFHGRADMQMKCSGYRVSPDEVEEATLIFPDICHAAVFGRPDRELGESVNLAYATYSRKPVDQDQLSRHLATALPFYAVPRHIYFYPSLPLTVTGKIDYPALRRDADIRGETDAGS